MHPERRRAIHEAIARLADGDRSGMRELVQELWPVLLDFARRGVPREQDAEDVAQEVFLRICARISEFDRSRDGVSWAFGIAGYEILTLRRRNHRRRETSDEGALLDHADPGVSQEEDFILRELAAALEIAVSHLSADDRSSLALVAAPAVGSTTGPAIRKRRQRALERLRAVWRRLYGES